MKALGPLALYDQPHDWTTHKLEVWILITTVSECQTKPKQLASCC